MANYVLVLDCSGSMRNALPEIRNEVRNEWLPWRLTHNGPNNVGMVTFSTEVSIRSSYTNSLQDLQSLVDSLTSGGLTSLWDALVVALLYEDPKPDGITVWTDVDDNRSSARRSEFEDLANRLNIPWEFLEIPEYWWDNDANARSNAYVFLGAETILTRPAYLEKLASVVKTLKPARLIRQPTQFLEKKKA